MYTIHLIHKLLSYAFLWMAFNIHPLPNIANIMQYLVAAAWFSLQKDWLNLIL